jgi:hypothetical protein
VNEHLKPNRVILKKDGEIVGFHFCRHSPDCEICSFLHSQVASLSFPKWISQRVVSFCSLMVAINPENPNLVREHIKLYLEGVLKLSSAKTLDSLRQLEMAIGFQIQTRGDFELGFYLKINLYFGGVLSNEIIQEFGMHFFFNNLTELEVNAEFGVVLGMDKYFAKLKSREGKFIVGVHPIPISFRREFSFLVESGLQPLIISDEMRLKSPIFHWTLRYS